MRLTTGNTVIDLPVAGRVHSGRVERTNEMRASVTVLSGPFAGQSIEVSHGKLLIGRELDCHLRPESALVSRHHCVLLLDDYTLRIRDLASKNGTFVNSRRVGTSETILSHEDLVSVGDMVRQVSLASATTEVEPTLRRAQPTPSPSSLEGTGVFEGDTEQGECRDVVSPPQAPPVSTPAVRSDSLTSSDDVRRNL